MTCAAFLLIRISVALGRRRSVARYVEIDAAIEAVPSPQWVRHRADRWRTASLQKQPAIVIGDECTKQSHQVSDGETKGSNGKVRPHAWLQSQGQVKKARIENERGRQIDQSAHANDYGDQGAYNEQN